MKKPDTTLLSGWLLILLLGALNTKIGLAESILSVENAWIPEAPPVSKVLAAYMTIHNNGAKDQKIVSASSPDFGAIEFHRTIERDGMAGMQPQDFLLIPANGSLALKPGDYHLMLFRPARKLRAGDETMLRFKTSKNISIDATATVKKASAESSHDHHHH